MNIKDVPIDNVKNILLIEPDYPTSKKNKYIPIGLLKIASYFRSKSKNVSFTNFNEEINTKGYNPDLICLSSYFVYRAPYTKKTVDYCRKYFPNVKIVVGGIYPMLLPEHCKEYTQCDYVITEISKEAEELIPAYDLVHTNHQVLFTTRGCVRRCDFCSVYKIEPEWTYKKTIKNEVLFKNILFYDNNLLANPYIEDILNELVELKKQRKIKYVKAQSGLDVRILSKKPHIGKLLKNAGFRGISLAWDGDFKDLKYIKKAINILVENGYSLKNINIFILYNYHNMNYEDIERKRLECAKLGVRVITLRYTPMDWIGEEKYLSPNWTEKENNKVKANSTLHNKCINYDIEEYNIPYVFETWKLYDFHKQVI